MCMLALLKGLGMASAPPPPRGGPPRRARCPSCRRRLLLALLPLGLGDAGGGGISPATRSSRLRAPGPLAGAGGRLCFQ
ncbi:MAG: hypothetical protein J3K34DRAFT_422780 [Monoraphidium minutum]|nr:MAG: hypothetical protein J3K34DRAFT_422780 [Monoraphidium minutum]